MTEAEFRELVESAREGRQLEFKRAAAWSDAEFKAKIVKCVLALSNVRDGGAIVIGVDELASGYAFSGISSNDLSTWDEDQVVSHVNEFADPYASLSIDKVQADGNWFVVIRVRAFDDIPVICKRDGASNLRKGAIYTRTRRIPESAEVPSQTELREILDMATEKGIKKLFTTLSRIGAGVPVPTDADKFNDQLGNLP